MGSLTTYASLGKAISRHRSRLDMTQQNLADAIGISRASVANIERGEQRVYFDQVLAIRDAFGLQTTEELMAGAEMEKKSAYSISFSGDKLKRTEKRQVKSLLDRYVGTD